MAIIAPALIAGRSQVIQTGTAKLGEGLRGLVGDTSKDAARKRRAADLTAAALAGDQAALRQLAFDAFEPANGERGDNRPIDRGVRSPPLTRDLSRKGLQQYAAKFGGLPPTLQKYAAELRVPVVDQPPPLLAQILAPAVEAVTDTALDRAAERGRQAAQSYTPLIVGGVVVVAVLFYMITTRK